MSGCERHREALLAGTIAPETSAHQVECPDCRELARGLAADREMFLAAHEAATPPSPDFDDVLHRAGRGSRAGRRGMLLAGALAAVTLLAVFQSPRQPGPAELQAASVAANPFIESEGNPFLELASAAAANPFQESDTESNPFQPASASTGAEFLFEADQRRF